MASNGDNKSNAESDYRITRQTRQGPGDRMSNRARAERERWAYLNDPTRIGEKRQGETDVGRLVREVQEWENLNMQKQVEKKVQALRSYYGHLPNDPTT